MTTKKGRRKIDGKFGASLAAVPGGGHSGLRRHWVHLSPIVEYPELIYHRCTVQHILRLLLIWYFPFLKKLKLATMLTT